MRVGKTNIEAAVHDAGFVFTERPDLQSMIERLAGAAVRFSQESCDVRVSTLDEASASTVDALVGIAAIEHVLDEHRDRIEALSEREKHALVAGFGGYIGEVMRRQSGAGTWGNVTMDGETFTAVQLAGGAIVWPTDKVRKRLVLGAEHGLVGYYCAMMRPHVGDAAIDGALRAIQ